jgi:hypothetical protein
MIIEAMLGAVPQKGNPEKKSFCLTLPALIAGRVRCARQNVLKL